MAISFTCQKCGREHWVEDRFAGKRAACKGCGHVNPIPLDVAPKAVITITGGVLTLGVRRPLSGMICPNCHNAMPAGAVLCTLCGYSVEAGLVVATDIVGAPPSKSPPLPGEEPEHPDAPPRPILPVLMLGSLCALLLAILIPVALMRNDDQPKQTAIISSDNAPEITNAPADSTAEVARDHSAEVTAAPAVADPPKPSADPPPAKPQQTPPPNTGGIWYRITDPGNFSARPTETVVPAPPPAPPPVDPEFFYKGRPKITIDAEPSSIFSDGIAYHALRIPAGQDPLEFYRPAMRHPDPKIRFAAIDVINKIMRDKGQAARTVADVLTDPNRGVRLAAVDAQGRARNPETIANLIRCLDDADGLVRESAVRALAKFKDESCIDALAAHVADDESTVRTALAEFGPEKKERIAKAFIGLFTHAEPKTRIAALRAVIADGSARSEILPLIDDPDIAVRRVAMNYLANVKYAPAMPRIAEHLRDDGEAAATELVKFGPAAENITIAKARADSDATTRLCALAVLNSIGTKASLPLAREAANADDPSVSAWAQQLWRKLTPDDVGPVDFALLDIGSTNPERLKRGLVALKETKPDAHQRAVARRLVELVTESPEPPVQELAGRALLVWANRDAKDALIALISPDADPVKRPRAIALISDLNEPRAIPALCDCAAKGTDWLLVSEALRRFGPDAEDGLLKLLRSDDRIVFIRACDLLRDVGTKKSLASLSVIAINGDPMRSARAKDAAAEINRRLGTGVKP